MCKKKWGKPKLIVLTKGKPEEAVLTGCKLQSVDGGDVFATAYGCALDMIEPGVLCGPCWGVQYS